jgi:imidazolonepropionase-like amidohydrolase
MMIALTGARLLDGTAAPPRDGMTVVVEGRSIAAVAPDGEAAVPEGAIRHDLAGRTLMPGLIDGHVHLLANAGTAQKDVHLWNVLTFIEEQTLHAAANARRALLAGVTTVRDMAGSRPEIAVKHAVDDGVIDGARVVVSGFVGMTGGHGDLFCPANIERRLWQTADGEDECRKLIRTYARDGVDFIKLCTSGGVLSIGDEAEWRNYTFKETLAIVDEAHALGKRVAAHAHTRAGIRQALEAGVDTLEHGSSLDDELIAIMVERGTWLCPTLAITEYILESGERRGLPPASLAKARALRPGQIAGLRNAYAAGVPIFMGTDSCNTMAFGRHAWELELLHRHLGMSPQETIVAATSSAAAAIGLGQRTGRIAPGFWADLLVVDGDPLADVRLLQCEERLLGVFRDGRLLVDRGMASPRAAAEERLGIAGGGAS